MLNFMFGVLGSVFFWMGFGVVGFLAGSAMLRYIAPKTFKFITTGHRRYDFEPGNGEVFLIITFVYLFWPIFLLGITIHLLISKVAFPLFCKAVKASLSIIPKITVEKD